MNRLFRIAVGAAAFAACVGCVPSRAPLPTAEFPNEPPSAEFRMPLKNPELLSPFGRRKREFHSGIDIRGRRGGGDPVLASRGGRVILAGTQRGYGRIVALRHADGYVTRYAHLKRLDVRSGETVEALQRIGLVGRSGRATTAHLHFEVLTPSGRFVDPWPLVKARSRP